MYLLYFCFVVGFIVLRSMTLAAHSKVLSDIESYPDACSPWAAEDGCTRIMWYQDNCTNVGDIPTNYSTVFAASPATFN